MTYLLLCFRGGALLDPRGAEGLSVVCLRQLLGGTTSRPRDELTSAIEQLGSELSLVNQPHYTALSAPALTRSLPALLALIQEALCEPALESAEVERCARSYASELEATWDNDGYLAWLWLGRRLFEGHPLARSVSLNPARVRAFSADELRAHWHTLFHRDALLACVSGSVEEEAVSELIEGLREALPEPPQGLQSMSPHELMPTLPLKGRSRLTLAHKADRRQAQLLMGHPLISPEHPDFWALRLGVSALGGTFSSPLMQEVRVKRGLSYGASASVAQQGACATFSMNATPEGSDAVETIEVMREVMSRAQRSGLSAGELEHARRYLTNAHPFRLETPAMRASLITRATLNGTSPERELEAPRWIAELSLEQVNQALSEHLHPEQLELVALSDPEHLGAIEEALGAHFDEVTQVEAGALPE